MKPTMEDIHVFLKEQMLNLEPKYLSNWFITQDCYKAGLGFHIFFRIKCTQTKTLPTKYKVEGGLTARLTTGLSLRDTLGKNSRSLPIDCYTTEPVDEVCIDCFAGHKVLEKIAYSLADKGLVDIFEAFDFKYELLGILTERFGINVELGDRWHYDWKGSDKIRGESFYIEHINKGSGKKEYSLWESLFFVGLSTAILAIFIIEDLGGFK